MGCRDVRVYWREWARWQSAECHLDTRLKVIYTSQLRVTWTPQMGGFLEIAEGL